MSNARKDIKTSSNFIRYAYLMTVFFLALTGFAQMPIFKRYYIADIPGLGWLAQFFVTHYMHYLAAILFIAFFAYFIIDYLITNRLRRKISVSGYVRGFILFGILASGIFLVVRNLAGYKFSAGSIVFFDLMHLSLVMLFLLAAFYSLVAKKQWTISR